MTLLGQFALWVAFLIGSFGAVLSFSGRWRDRPDLERAVIRSVYALAAALRHGAIAADAQFAPSSPFKVAAE